jgi:hypothetical protein
MSKNRVFIYGSCVSRDTFEHFNPDQFELVQYVARQSALSAYSRPVTLMEPPAIESRFQQRMVAADFASSLQTLIPEAASRTDLVLVDLTDERLGAYVLPDGSVVTRSPELIQSGAEHHLPEGSQHLAFGSEQHFQYWSHAIATVGELIHQHMPRAAVALLDVPWAEWSETGTPTPDSFGVGAREANLLYRRYITTAAEALRALVISISPEEVTSSPDHPWGEAPFHFSSAVYRTLTIQITGSEGRKPWTAGARGNDEGHATSTAMSLPRATSGKQPEDTTPALPPLEIGPNLIIAGTQRAGVSWLRERLAHHPDVFVAGVDGRNFFSHPGRLSSPEQTASYEAAYSSHGGARWRIDATPTYFWHANGGPFSPRRHDAAQAISNRLGPGAQMMVVLRDPVSRALAGYWHTFAGGHFKGATSPFQVPPHFGVIDLGFYRRHYEHWSKILGPDRMHVVLYDDLVTDPQGYLQQVLQILELEPSSDYWESAGLQDRNGRRMWLEPFKKQSEITAQEVAALLELYREDIAFVEELVGRDLPTWYDLDGLISLHTSSRK